MAAHRQIIAAHRQRRYIQRPRHLHDGTNPLELIDEAECFIRYRFRPNTVMFIVDLIGEEIVRPTERSSPLTAIQQVCCCLRYLATGTFQSVIGDTISISQSLVSRACLAVTTALAAKVREFVSFPRGARAAETKQGFGALNGNYSL